MKRHIGNGVLLAVSSPIPSDRASAVIVAGRTAETQAEKVLADIPDGNVPLWCTPPHNSLTGELLVRRVFRDGETLEWGPPVSIVDRPEVYALIEHLSRELGDA